MTIVGYTNAGKSTLLNRLTHAGVLVEDRLFATLDPTTRRLSLPGGEPVLLTDTVGFVRRLPHGLVEAFKSTLEVATTADFLVHVVDAQRAGPRRARSPRCTRCSARSAPTQVPELLVFNKADVAPDEAKALVAEHAGSVAISAATGEGIDELPAGARRPPARDRHGRRAARSRTSAATCSPRSTARARWSPPPHEDRRSAGPGPAGGRLGRAAARVRRRGELSRPARAGRWRPRRRGRTMLGDDD